MSQAASSRSGPPRRRAGTYDFQSPAARISEPSCRKTRLVLTSSGLSRIFVRRLLRSTAAPTGSCEVNLGGVDRPPVRAVRYWTQNFGGLRGLHAVIARKQINVKLEGEITGRVGRAQLEIPICQAAKHATEMVGGAGTSPEPALGIISRISGKTSGFAGKMAAPRREAPKNMGFQQIAPP
jgi:hypothetical protein